MSARWQYKCTYCDRVFQSGQIVYQCVCTAPVGQNLYVSSIRSATEVRHALQASQVRDLWRYEALLPIGREYGSFLSVGGTPLLDIGNVSGVRLLIKDDTRNPSGSFKDRATEVALAVARSMGHSEVVTASTGNAAASLACIAAAQGIRARIVVPRTIPAAKLAQLRAYGASVDMVDGSYADAVAHARHLSQAEGIYCRSTGYNPFVREGKKTCAFEIAEQLDWQVPDWVILPCGDGNILSGVGTGFEQLLELGFITRLPRLVAAQAEGSASIAHTLAQWSKTGLMPQRPQIVHPRTAADSISVSEPMDHMAALRVLRRSNGLAITSTEDQLRESWFIMSRRYGIWLEPAGAAAHSALLQLIAGGRISPGQTVALVATGSGLKDPHVWAEG